MAAKSLKATLPSHQSTTKVPREPILITENEGEKFFPRFARNNHAPCLYLAAFQSVNALIYQPPHPWGASDGPGAHDTYSCENIAFWLWKQAGSLLLK